MSTDQEIIDLLQSKADEHGEKAAAHTVDAQKRVALAKIEGEKRDRYLEAIHLLKKGFS